MTLFTNLNDSVFIFQYVGAEFICAVQPILKERWTAELEEAWKVKPIIHHTVGVD